MAKRTGFSVGIKKALLALVMVSAVLSLSAFSLADPAGVEVKNADELITALNSGESPIILTDNISVGDCTLNMDNVKDVTINPNSFTLTISVIRFTNVKNSKGTVTLPNWIGSLSNDPVIRVRKQVSVRGLTSGETVQSITFSKSKTDSIGDMKLQVSDGYITADFKCLKDGSVMTVQSMATDDGSYRIGTKSSILAKEYRITYFNSDPESGEKTEELKGLQPESFTAEDNIIMLPTQISVKVEKYAFSGWSVNGMATIVKFDPGSMTGDVEAIAIWKKSDERGSGGWGGRGGFSGSFSAMSGATADNTTTEAMETVPTASNPMGGRRVKNGVSKTQAVFSDDTPANGIDLSELDNSKDTSGITTKLLILGVSLVVVAGSAIFLLLKKKR